VYGWIVRIVRDSAKPFAAWVRRLGILMLTPTLVLAVFPLAAAFYYLVWKHLVGFSNEVVSVA
jgi:hypothetical protein